MKNPMIRTLTLLVLLALLVPLQAAPFTFQGYLDDNGTPIDGSADLVFRLFEQSAGGSAIGGPLNFPSHPVNNGVFSVELDFSGEVFDGSDRYLDIELNGQPLSPRIRVTPAPLAGSANALRGYPVSLASPSAGQALVWDGASWAPQALAGGSYTAGTGLELLGDEFSIALPYRLPDGGCGAGEVVKWNAGSWACAVDADTSYSAGPGLDLAGSSFSVDFAGSGSADTVARSDHDHFGENWTGISGFWGLRVENNASSAVGLLAVADGHLSKAVHGANHAVDNFGIGVEGTAQLGVVGRSDTVQGTSDGVGVLGSRTGPGGFGVSGIASHDANSATVPVFGRHEKVNGVAILGRSANTDAGTGIGVHGESLNIGGTGVLGEGSTGVRGSGSTGVAADGTDYGISGFASGSTGVGVEGWATEVFGTTVGVDGAVISPDGIALNAKNWAGSGPGLALQAESLADDGTAARILALGSGATVGLRSLSVGEDPDAMAIHAQLNNGSGEGTALFAEHRGGGVAVKLDGVLRMIPRNTPPASCELGDLYVDTSGGLCFCHASGSPGLWEQINAHGVCP